MKKLQITQKETVDKMVNSLLDHANARGITLPPVTDVHGLDEIFNDGGEARCEHFADMAWEYALQFVKFDSDKFNAAQWSCIQKALAKLNKITRENSQTLYICYIAGGYVYGASTEEDACDVRWWSYSYDAEIAIVEIKIKNLTKERQEIINALCEHGTSGQVYSDGYDAADKALELSKRFTFTHKGSRFYW